MRATENITGILHHSLGSSPWRLVRRPGTLGGLAFALVAMLVLASCGASKRSSGPDLNSTGTGGDLGGNPTDPTAGQPSAQFAFSTSELDLIKSTSGTNGWVTI